MIDEFYYGHERADFRLSEGAMGFHCNWGKV